MITAKFGGTAVTPRNLIFLQKTITPFHNCVVVSAVGKEYPQDTKTTDLLLSYFQTRDEQVWDAIANKYRRLVEYNGIDVDIEALLTDAKCRVATHDLEYCASLGEELSAKVVARFLNAQYIEAQDVVRFTNGVIDIDKTYSAIVNATKGVKLAVVGGFYGGEGSNRRTFTRGGSDVSGAIFASALDSSLYENWTDVYGVCVANPTKVHGVQTVSTMSYAEMLLLSQAGAEVLHPDAIAPVEDKGIPIRIANFFSPSGASTLISHCPSHNKLLSIAEKDLDGLVQTTVLHSYSDWQIARILSRFFKKNTQLVQYFGKTRSVNLVAVHNVELCPNIVRLTTDSSIINDLYKSFN